MIISETVWTKPTGRSIQRYKDLGYDTDVGGIEVKVCDLSKSSAIKVKAQCGVCGEVREVPFHQYTPRCLDCARKSFAGENNPKWGGGKNKCTACGKETSGYTQTLCMECFLSRDQSGDKNPQWAGGKPSCIVCGKPLRDWRGKSCRTCYLELTRKDPTIKRQRNKATKGWTKEVLKKANYTCDYCGKYNADKLVAHHLNSFDTYIAERFDPDNGVCLCKNCHHEFHMEYGFGNNTLAQYLEFKENAQ